MWELEAGSDLVFIFTNEWILDLIVINHVKGHLGVVHQTSMLFLCGIRII